MVDAARVRWFTAALDEPVRAAAEQVPDLDGHLARVVEAARAAWPAIHVDDGAFLAHVASRLTGEAVAELLARLPAGDLYLACACAAGDPAALRAFDDHFLADLDGTLARAGIEAGLADEVKQRLRIKLFVADGGDAPQIADYTGRGELRGWLRVTALRLALNALRAVRREVAGDEAQLDTQLAGADPALDHLKTRYRGEFRAAVRDAMALLEPRERNLLRQYYLDGLTFDKLSRIYRVHLATAARWVERARDALLAATRRVLMDRLRVDRAEVDSILRLIESQLDVSASDLLS